ncbi:MAG: hypothetical protein GPJ54_18595 [Candidatus Heimdallarchaeota archaeon]|nr:hypothetical protein [Candidatus Heimdallarchaeota archaeon]
MIFLTASNLVYIEFDVYKDKNDIRHEGRPSFSVLESFGFQNQETIRITSTTEQISNYVYNYFKDQDITLRELVIENSITNIRFENVTGSSIDIFIFDASLLSSLSPDLIYYFSKNQESENDFEYNSLEVKYDRMLNQDETNLVTENLQYLGLQANEGYLVIDYLKTAKLDFLSSSWSVATESAFQVAYPANFPWHDLLDREISDQLDPIGIEIGQSLLIIDQEHLRYIWNFQHQLSNLNIRLTYLFSSIIPIFIISMYIGSSFRKESRSAEELLVIAGNPISNNNRFFAEFTIAYLPTNLLFVYGLLSNNSYSNFLIISTILNSTVIVGQLVPQVQIETEKFLIAIVLLLIVGIIAGLNISGSLDTSEDLITLITQLTLIIASLVVLALFVVYLISRIFKRMDIYGIANPYQLFTSIIISLFLINLLLVGNWVQQEHLRVGNAFQDHECDNQANCLVLEVYSASYENNNFSIIVTDVNDYFSIIDDLILYNISYFVDLSNFQLEKDIIISNDIEIEFQWPIGVPRIVDIELEGNLTTMLIKPRYSFEAIPSVPFDLWVLMDHELFESYTANPIERTTYLFLERPTGIENQRINQFIISNYERIDTYILIYFITIFINIALIGTIFRYEVIKASNILKQNEFMEFALQLTKKEQRKQIQLVYFFIPLSFILVGVIINYLLIFFSPDIVQGRGFEKLQSSLMLDYQWGKPILTMYVIEIVLFSIALLTLFRRYWRV